MSVVEEVILLRVVKIQVKALETCVPQKWNGECTFGGGESSF